MWAFLFPHQDYYQRLEQLQRTHLRNMAELEKMYICKRSKVNKKDDEEEYEEDKCLEREGRDIQDLQPRSDIIAFITVPFERELRF